MSGRAQNWVRFGLVVLCLLIVVIAALVLFGPHSSACSGCNAPGNHPTVPLVPPSATGS
jgi:hypothetical protein